jgi:sarcosine oxidase/L-pipecolate oxidase
MKIPDLTGAGETVEVSLPKTTIDDPTQWVPQEGEDACRAALKEIIPSLAERPFTHARICWYTDTPRGDFLITYHPDFEGLFLATGGSGHAFKFLPAIGSKVVDCVEGKCSSEFKDKWAWPNEPVHAIVTEDGSRSGRPVLILDTELRKVGRL